MNNNSTTDARSTTIEAAGDRTTSERRLHEPSSPGAPAGARRTRRSRRVGLLAGAALIAIAATACFPTGPVETWVPDFNGNGRIEPAEVEWQKATIVQNVARAIEADRRARQNHPFLTCVRRHESDRGPWPHANGYGAQNPRSTASGAYQFLDSTWRNVSARSGHGGYSKARYAPWYVQDAVALYLVNNGGRSAWNGTGC
jgi:hypothetical protein